MHRQGSPREGHVYGKSEGFTQAFACMGMTFPHESDVSRPRSWAGCMVGSFDALWGVVCDWALEVFLREGFVLRRRVSSVGI